MHKTNYIEYDEEAYNKILNTLNGINGSDAINACANIRNAVAGFPDNYSSGGINSIESNLKEHVNLIKSLSETTNYSILAYDTCDESLRDGLYSLIDSLFGDSDKTFGDKFKKAIEHTLEMKDGILRNKDDTNYNKTSCILKILLDNPDAIFLMGEELKKFKEKHNVRDIDSLIVTKSTTDINGVEFDIYGVIDANTVDIDSYNLHISKNIDMASRIDENVLRYIRDGGFDIVCYSDYTVDNDCYPFGESVVSDEYGSYSGFFHPEANAVVINCAPSNAEHSESLLHEFGHALDYTVHNNIAGRRGLISVDIGENLLPSIREQSFYDIASKDSKKLFDPSACNNYGLEYNSDEFGGRVMEFSEYYDYELIEADYAAEFFAEAFKIYYSGGETRKKLEYLIPDTLDYISRLESWVGDQYANR